MFVNRFEPSINKANYGCIICDESHYLKSLTAKRTRALLPILKRAKHCILLSGTPALSRPIELYNQISVLSDKFGSYHDFGVRYAKAKKGRFGWEYKLPHKHDKDGTSLLRLPSRAPGCLTDTPSHRLACCVDCDPIGEPPI